MRILITNDDGINAPGLVVAERIAAEIAGPDGEVWVISPENERSGASHAISYTVGMRLHEIGERRYSIDGFPADCALVGIHRILRDSPPDLVISGVNRGHNVAEDVIYSGTVGAAMEGALSGIRSVAMSQFYSKDGPADLFASSRTMGVEVLRKVLKMPFRGSTFYNINFPALPPEEVLGVKVCPQGLRADATFDVMDFLAPNGRTYQFLRHGTRNSSAPEGSDANLCYHGWVTVTPLHAQMTDMDLLEDARAALG